MRFSISAMRTRLHSINSICVSFECEKSVVSEKKGRYEKTALVSEFFASVLTFFYLKKAEPSAMFHTAIVLSLDTDSTRPWHKLTSMLCTALPVEIRVAGTLSTEFVRHMPMLPSPPALTM